MVGAPAAADAVARARRLPTLKVGLHVVVVDGRPVLPAERIPDLVDASGRFPVDILWAGITIFVRPAARRQLEAEIRAQFAAFRATGLTLDHVNAHHHFHMHPTVLRTILKVGRDFGLRAVRVPYEPVFLSWRATRTGLLARLAAGAVLAPWVAMMRWRLRRADVRTNDYMFGLTETGRMGADVTLRYLAGLPDGISELYFHPTTGDQPNGGDTQDFRALTSGPVVQALRASDIRLIGFSDL